MKKALAAIGILILPLAGYLYQKARNANRDKKQLYVGVELGGTNYKVAIGQSVTNNKGQVIDFKIIKRKEGVTYNDPKECLAEIVEFISSILNGNEE